MDAKFLRRIRFGTNRLYELQVFATDRPWIRLRDVADETTLGFCSRSEGPGDWRSLALRIAGELCEGHLAEPPVWALELWEPGWDFWGPGIPGPIQWLVPRLDSMASLHSPRTLAEIQREL